MSGGSHREISVYRGGVAWLCPDGRSIWQRMFPIEQIRKQREKPVTRDQGKPSRATPW